MWPPLRPLLFPAGPRFRAGTMMTLLSLLETVGLEHAQLAGFEPLVLLVNMAGLPLHVVAMRATLGRQAVSAATTSILAPACLLLPVPLNTLWAANWADVSDVFSFVCPPLHGTPP